MYLCDLMASLSDKLGDPKIFSESQKIPGRHDIERFLDFSTDLIGDKEVELYAYDRSALLAAGDLRVDRQKDIEKIADMIFSKPRKVFIEANYLDREKAFSKVRMLPDTGNPMIGKPVRVGNYFDIKGDGKATMHVVWTTPKSEIRKVVPDVFKQCGVHKSAQKILFNAQTFNVSSHYLEINTSNRSCLSLEEFIALTKDASTDQYSILQHSKHTNRDRNLSESKELKEAYDLFRLNALAEMKFDRRNIARLSAMSSLTGIPPGDIIKTLQGDLDGELVLGVGMLALLEIDDLDITIRDGSRRQRVRDRKGRSRWERPEKVDFERPVLSVVNMKIGDDLVAALFSDSSTQGESGRLTSGGRQSPTMHAVRGHMFRARNGKLVYRKPHFRGHKAKRSLTKVSV
jgi:hypothetical protein